MGHKVASGSVWTVGARLTSRAIDLATMLVLARLLTPSDFGLVAIAMSVIVIVEAILEMPVSAALVRMPEITADHYDTAFTVSLLRGLAVTLILCSLSIPFASFYKDARLILLVCALSLAPAARGLTSPKMVDFVKTLSFWREFAMEISGKAAALAIAVSVAVVFRSYWSIALGTIVAPLTNTVVSYIFAPYRPRLSLGKMSALQGFLGWVVVAQVLNAINWQADRLILGKLTSAAALGEFSNANDLASIPLGTVTGPATRPLLSAFTLIQSDPKRLAASYQSSAAAMVTLGLPILLGESLIADPVVRLMFGAKWIGAIPLLHWLALSIIPSLFAVPLGSLVMTLGRTEIFVRRNAFEICIKIPLVIIGAIKFRFFGVIAARLISETCTVIYAMIVIRGLIGLSVWSQVIAPWRGILSGLAMAGVLWYSVPHLTHRMGTGPLALGTAAAIALGAATYTGTLLGLWTLAGRPRGIEAIVVGRVSSLLA
jgi:PST family polysaccharide transporter